MENKLFMLTTKDNPFDPFEDFTSWFCYDVSKGYNSCGKLARILDTLDVEFDELTEKEESAVIEQAIDSWVSINPLGNYKKFTKIDTVH